MGGTTVRAFGLPHGSMVSVLGVNVSSVNSLPMSDAVSNRSSTPFGSTNSAEVDDDDFDDDDFDDDDFDDVTTSVRGLIRAVGCGRDVVVVVVVAQQQEGDHGDDDRSDGNGDDPLLVRSAGPGAEPGGGPPGGPTGRSRRRPGHGRQVWSSEASPRWASRPPRRLVGCRTSGCCSGGYHLPSDACHHPSPCDVSLIGRLRQRRRSSLAPGGCARPRSPPGPATAR